MEIRTRFFLLKVSILLLGIICALPAESEAQRFSRGGGNRSAPSRQVQRPSTPSHQATRPTTNRPTQSRPNNSTSRPNNTNSRPKINGGNQVSPDRKVKTPNNAKDALDKHKSGNTNIGNKTNIGDRGDVNIGSNNRGDVNINIDNSRHVNMNNRNTVVRRPVRPYPRPPYRYGGHFYFSFHPYYYHPYRPFYWGPVWHPWGFFVATLATTAIIVSVENQKYHYDQGVYYVEGDGGYTVVQAPVGATVKTIPDNSEQVTVNETTNNYYYGGAFYEKDSNGYTVVPATAGTIVPNLPEGGEEVKLGDVTYVQFGDTYYQPVQVDGKDMYEIVDVQDSDE